MKILMHFAAYSTVALVALVIGAAIMSAGTPEAAGADPSTFTATATSTATVTEPGPTTTTTATSPATTVTKTSTTTAEPAAPETAIPGDGTFEVGVDIEPGTYVSEPADSGMCYWARLSGSDGFDNIIDNNISSGQSIVTISASDTFFETSGCNGWSLRE